MNSFESVATDFLLVGNQAFIAGWNFNNACMWSQTNDVFLNGTVRTNSALNKDYSHNYHMERKKLDKQTSECSYEIIMILHTKLL